MKLTQFYIDGQWVDPVTPESLDVINPATEQVAATISVGSSADVDKAVAAARRAFAAASRASVQERLELLTEIRETYKRRFDDVATAIRTEMGAPVNLARGAQATVGLNHLKTAIRVLGEHKFEFEHNGFLMRHEPIGVCGLITPWNWPINQIVSKVAPCIASGSTMVLKPSEIAPLSAMIFAEIIDEAGAPAGLFNLVNGYGPVVGEAMSAHPDIDMMSFTGSTRGGAAVARASAEGVKRVSQELGGKSPYIVLDDAAFAKSVADGVENCMSNTGQSCNAPTRMIVPADRHDEALEIAAKTCADLVTGDPQDEATEIGPLVSSMQFEKVQGLIEKGIEEGARLVAGGTGKPEGLNSGYFVRPTVFGHVDNDMTIAREEIFGPVLSVISYDDLDDAVRIGNDTEYGLAAYISGEDKDKILTVARQLRAGQIHINNASGGSDAPFGGYGKSGNGREKAEWGLNEFLEVKAIIGA